MNFNISNQAISNTWKHSKLQYVTLAAGLALAVSAVAGLNGSFKSDSATSVSPRSATTTFVRQADPPAFVLFIVDNQERANALQSAISTDSASYAGVSSTQFDVWVVQDEQQQHGLNEAMREQGLNAQFVDLREGAFKPEPVYSPTSVRSSANESAEEYASREAAQILLASPAAISASAIVVESPETIAAGEAWQHGSLSSAAPARAIVVESPETIAAGEAWQHGSR